MSVDFDVLGGRLSAGLSDRQQRTGVMRPRERGQQELRRTAIDVFGDGEVVDLNLTRARTPAHVTRAPVGRPPCPCQHVDLCSEPVLIPLGGLPMNP
jgi:hypothetical protein